MPFWVATDFTIWTGDGHDLPVANHVSESVTQKSGSLCVMMDSLSVVITLLLFTYFCPCLSRCAITAELSKVYSGVWADVRGVAVSLLSKLISVNTGTESDSSGVS